MVLYIAYLPDRLFMNTPVKIYSISCKKEYIVTFQNFLSEFPIPPQFPQFSTPIGHLFIYNNYLKITHILDEYNLLIERIYNNNKLLSKL